MLQPKEKSAVCMKDVLMKHIEAGHAVVRFRAGKFQRKYTSVDTKAQKSNWEICRLDLLGGSLAEVFLLQDWCSAKGRI